jgi:hypothetical protein
VKHDPNTCPTCGPYIHSAPYKKGVAEAERAVARAKEGMDRDD